MDGGFRLTMVLVIEDNDMNREIMFLRLQARGFQVELAEDGRQGVEKAHAVLPDLILMDLNLPEIDGWEATRQLKAAPDTRAIPVIALSAQVGKPDIDRVLKAGANDFFPKPVNMPKLVAKILELVAVSGA